MRQTVTPIAEQVSPFTTHDERFVRENRILSLDTVLSVVPTTRQTIYRWMCKGQFPQAVKIGGAMIGFRESEVLDWLNTRPRALGGDKKSRAEHHGTAQT